MLTVPPTIADSASEYSVTEGSSVRLACDVEGDPKPEVTWSKNGMRISDTDPHYFVDGSGSLKVLSVDQRDTATYSCTAVNIAGITEKRINLLVHSQLYTNFRLFSLRIYQANRQELRYDVPIFCVLKN